MRRRVKIGATLGPATADPDTLSAMVEAGLDVARINFSHGNESDQREAVRALRRAERRVGRRVSVLADLQGPRFRVGLLPGGGIDLGEGERVDLLSGRERGSGGAIPVSYRALAREVSRGDPILLDDGKLALRVESVRGDRVRCRVVRGGRLSDRKGVNLPAAKLDVPALTRKDRRDLALAAEIGADWLAVSFVRRPEDVRAARRLLARAGREIPVMAKIERPEAIERLESILDEADAILVARGDLGVEMAAERVPALQKSMIAQALAARKPVMTATQMLDSMRNSPRPTRAETSDVANAVLDGTDALLLTGETAVGSYPLEAVRTLVRIAEETERSGIVRRPPEPRGGLSVAEAACLAAARAASQVGARWIVAFTRTGATASVVAGFRPDVPVLAFTPTAATAGRLGPVWGVEARRLSLRRSTDELVAAVGSALVDEGLAVAGDVVVVLAGAPTGRPGETDLVKIHRIAGSRRRRHQRLR